MQELALYRKYRPMGWGDVLGQEHVVTVLKTSIKNGVLSHAYIFSGSRGTGKTSIARILAHELKVSESDTYEIDAASNRGIDDIRGLRESVRTSPFDSKYKIYIIDEVHMLTKEAWNALLKTLEEPPLNVIFILATTELEKIPDTIVSRCQTFSFKKPTEATLKRLIADVAKKEGYSIDSAGIELIALLGDGSFRDTLGILQKVTSFSGDKKIDRDEIEKVTGAPSKKLIDEFLESLVSSDIERGLLVIRKAVDQNIDVKVYLKLVLQKMRAALFIRFAPNSKEFIDDLSESDIEFLQTILKKDLPQEGGKGILSSKTLEILLASYQKIDNSFIKELPLELAFIDILNK